MWENVPKGLNEYELRDYENKYAGRKEDYLYMQI